MISRSGLARVAAATCLALLITACGEPEQENPRPGPDAAIDEAIIDVMNGGDTIALRDVTQVEWDEVALFGEGTPRTEIEQVVGPTGLLEERYLSSPNLLVLRNDGQIVQLVTLAPDAFVGEFGVLLGPDAELAAPPDSLVVLRNPN